MSVSHAKIADIEDLLPLFSAYLQFYRREPAPADLRGFLQARLQQGDSTLLLARDAQGKAVGFVQLYPLFASLELRRSCLLSDLYVAADARRQGIGELLMQAARAHAESIGACGLQLETAKDNLAGQSLYERLGYERDEVFYTYWLAL
jgi:ribosomal protein S18 acetylase RimI-like enzyme